MGLFRRRPLDSHPGGGPLVESEYTTIPAEHSAGGRARLRKGGADSDNPCIHYPVADGAPRHASARKGGNIMKNALVISNSEKGTDFIIEVLSSASINDITTLKTCGEARMLLSEREIDLVVINAPLSDETGEGLARQIVTESTTQAILIVKHEYFDDISAACAQDGVLTVAKPINMVVFTSALKLAGSVQSRLRLVFAENTKLKQKIEDVRIVNRAKLLLLSHLKMSERDAHRYIEKQAMDMRSTRRAVAEGILRTYEIYPEAEHEPR
jgi:response regulator NasT